MIAACPEQEASRCSKSASKHARMYEAFFFFICGWSAYQRKQLFICLFFSVLNVNAPDWEITASLHVQGHRTKWDTMREKRNNERTNTYASSFVVYRVPRLENELTRHVIHWQAPLDSEIAQTSRCPSRNYVGKQTISIRENSRDSIICCFPSRWIYKPKHELRRYNVVFLVP